LQGLTWKIPCCRGKRRRCAVAERKTLRVALPAIGMRQPCEGPVADLWSRGPPAGRLNSARRNTGGTDGRGRPPTPLGNQFAQGLRRSWIRALEAKRFEFGRSPEGSRYRWRSGRNSGAWRFCPRNGRARFNSPLHGRAKLEGRAGAGPLRIQPGTEAKHGGFVKEIRRSRPGTVPCRRKGGSNPQPAFRLVAGGEAASCLAGWPPGKSAGCRGSRLQVLSVRPNRCGPGKGRQGFIEAVIKLANRHDLMPDAASLSARGRWHRERGSPSEL